MTNNNTLYDLDKKMIEYREACKNPTSQEYKDKQHAEKIFSKPFHF